MGQPHLVGVLGSRMSFEVAQILSMLALWLVALAAVHATMPFAIQPPAGTPRSAHLDGLRGMAAIGVVSCHLTQYTMAFAGFEDVPHIGNHVGILSVQIFFALTAYLFTDRALTKGLTIRLFLFGRIRRILPLYIVAVFVAVALGLHYTSDIDAPAAQTLKEIVKIASFGFWRHDTLSLKGLDMLSLIGIAWTLSYEWGFYLLLIPSYLLWQRLNAAAPLLVFAAIVGAVWHMSVQTEQVIWPFFLPGVIGALARRYVSTPPPVVISLLPWIAAGLLALVVMLPGYWTLNKLLLMTGAFLSIQFSRPLILQWRPLVALGTISYSVYLLQYLLIYPVVRAIYEFPAVFDTLLYKFAAMALVMLVLIPVACVSYVLVERPFLGTGATHKGKGSPVRIGASA